MTNQQFSNPNKAAIWDFSVSCNYDRRFHHHVATDGCLAGPNNNPQKPPQYCPPTRECQTTRLQTIDNTCAEPQGFYEPIVCAPGYFCPSGGTRQVKCPGGSYCPLGSFEPLPCSAISACPVGSSRQFPLTGLVALILIDCVILLGVVVPLLYRQTLAWVSRANRFNPLHHRGDVEVSQAVPNSTPDELGYSCNGNALSLKRFLDSLKRCIESDETGLGFEFNDLSFQVKGGRKILGGVSGIVPKGSVLAVMGASGAGKSTFVRVLMGKLKSTSGSIAINGIPRSMSEFKKIIGYVAQDDTVLPELTVRENLLHSARIRLPPSWTDHEIQEHVDNLISCLQLTHIQHSRVGDAIKPMISGGQRKRVSIGIELAAAPMALVLDEPTSGLDATSALSIIELLKSLSQLGVTIICIIHQPRVEILLALERLLLLACGREVYLGPTAAAADYFRSLGYTITREHNPADAIMDIISGQGQRYGGDASKNAAEIAHHLNASWNQQRDQINPTTKEGPTTANHEERLSQIYALSKSAANRGAPWYRQVSLCFMRSLKQQSRQLVGFFLEIAVGAVAGLLIGLSVYKLGGLLFQGIFHPPFELLSSAVNYTLVPELGLLCSLAIGKHDLQIVPHSRH